ncbi:MAG: FAD-dependent oxidoreductase [Desulfobacterales bacterium]|nr:FAD-dependent oxidoreductase [Desulfobacterales bacterium]
MSHSTAEVVICGAGIAGIAAAYHLTVKHGLRNVLLVDERPPLTLTSDKGTECYRNWWPGPGDAMVSLMNRSVDIMEDLARQSGNVFSMNRRGYLFATADSGRIADFKRAAEGSAVLGAGPVRYHTGRAGEPAYAPAKPQGFDDPLTGADVITDRLLIRKHFPYLSEQAVAVLHARRCGWFSAQQYGMFMLEEARSRGCRLVRGRVEGVEMGGGRVQAVEVAQESGTDKISTDNFVVAGGPITRHVARLMDIDLPIFCELHIKVVLKDHKGVFPRDCPLVIWTDPIKLPWSQEERAALADSPETRHLLDEFPAGVHARPEGGAENPYILILWTYDTRPVEPVFPLPLDAQYPEIALRGLSVMIPSLAAYFDRAAKPVLDGGYYAKTRENRPLIGPLPVGGAYIIGALSGFGLMASAAGGELVAAHLTGGKLPPYAPAFTLDRYDDPAYRQLLETWDDSGQL